MSGPPTATRDFIRELAQMPDGKGKHAAFIYGVLREPLFDTALMAEAMKDEPLTEAAMLHLAAEYPQRDPQESAR